MNTLLDLIYALQRCPHGRLPGDACLGHTGPSMFDGGCLGGRSLGNPHLGQRNPMRLGTDLHGFPITVNDIAHAAGIDHRSTYMVVTARGNHFPVRTEDPAGPNDAIIAAKQYSQEHREFAHAVEMRSCLWVLSETEVAVKEAE
jgi:hypothetical protein